MHLRDKYLKQFRTKSDPATIILYKKFRNRVANELKESKINYFHNYINENSKNMKLFWTRIKSIISVQNSSVNVINKLKDANGNLTSDSTTMATVFNDFFVHVADGITKIMPRTPESPLNYLLDNKNQNSFFITPSAPYEVLDIINTLKTGKSIGPNSIPIKL